MSVRSDVMDVALVVVLMVVAFIGVVVYTVWNDIQGLDNKVYQSNRELVEKIFELQSEVDRLNNKIETLQDNGEDDGNTDGTDNRSSTA